MKVFRDLSIRRKLTLLFMAIAGITAAMVSVPMAVHDFLAFKEGMAREMTTLAEVMARNSTAALTFHDAAGARDVLQVLQAEPDVTRACLYTADNKPLATYTRGGKVTGFQWPEPQDQGIRFEQERLVQFRDVTLAGEHLGKLYIESDLERLHARLRAYGIAFLVTAGLAFILAFLISSRFQRPISRPLLDLVQTTEAVARAADYSIRAALPNRDEFGHLVSAFNGMLEQIEKRDRQLREQGEHLEEEVASRTSDLFAANRQLKLHASALKAAANSILITDESGAIVWTNPAFSVLSGYSAEEVLGKNPRILSSGGQEKEFFTQLWATIKSGKTWRGELVNRRKNGTLYTEEMTVTPVSLQTGEITHFIAIKQDITERKQAELALQQAEEKYRTLFEDAVVGIFQTTPDGRPLSINRALAEMHGYDSPEHLLAEVSNAIAELFVDPNRMNELRQILQEQGGAGRRGYDRASRRHDRRHHRP